MGTFHVRERLLVMMDWVSQEARKISVRGHGWRCDWASAQFLEHQGHLTHLQMCSPRSIIFALFSFYCLKILSQQIVESKKGNPLQMWLCRTINIKQSIIIRAEEVVVLDGSRSYQDLRWTGSQKKTNPWSVLSTESLSQAISSQWWSHTKKEKAFS
jgi:hypothetical protein